MTTAEPPVIRLALDHVTNGVAAHYNLMWPALRAGDRLEAGQITIAQNSSLAKAFAPQSGARP